MVELLEGRIAADRRKNKIKVDGELIRGRQLD
jgi:hypothetical protein